MTPLTKEYFDQRVASLATAQALEQLATMVKEGFDATDEKFAQVIDRLDVRTELDQLKADIRHMKGKLEEALHVSL